MEAHGFPHEGKFTAKEVRKIADCFNTGNGFNIYEDCGDGVSLCAVKTIDCQSALRQGADAIEENAQLKARLAAVVKECERRMKEYDCGACDFTDEPPWTFERCEIKGCPTRLHAMEFLSILRAARGEGGAE